MSWYKRAKANKQIKTAVISPDTARALNTGVEMPSDPRFLDAVQNTDGARITEDGLEIELTRNQHPAQGDTQSLRSGVFYQPTGSKSKGKYKSKDGKEVWYGGSEEITGTTLLRRPIFVKGATGGLAPQMAYDFMKGKGSYEAMRKDVARVVMAFESYRRTPPNDTYQMVWDLLHKYGGDVDLAGELFHFNQIAVGNNMAYAIQENIVACTVRQAGYDSVIGYSIQRKNGIPFISEVFDIRETTYPSKWNSEGVVHETFLQQENVS